MSGRVVTNIQIRAESEFIHPIYNMDANLKFM